MGYDAGTTGSWKGRINYPKNGKRSDIPFHVKAKTLGLAGILAGFPRVRVHPGAMKWSDILVGGFAKENVSRFRKKKLVIDDTDDLLSFVAEALDLIASDAPRSKTVEYLRKIVSVNGHSKSLVFATLLSNGSTGITETEESTLGFDIVLKMKEQLEKIRKGERFDDAWFADLVKFSRHIAVKMVGMMLYAILVKREGVPCIAQCDIQRTVIAPKEVGLERTVSYDNLSNAKVSADYIPFPEKIDDFHLASVSFPAEMREMMALVSVMSAVSIASKISCIRLTNEVDSFPSATMMVPSPGDAVCSAPYFTTWLATYGLSMLPTVVDGRHFLDFDPDDADVFSGSYSTPDSGSPEMDSILALASFADLYGNSMGSGFQLLAHIAKSMPDFGGNDSSDVRKAILTESKYALWHGTTCVEWKENGLRSILLTPLSDGTFFIADTTRVDVSHILGVPEGSEAMFRNAIVPYYFFTRLPAIASEDEWRNNDSMKELSPLHYAPIEAIRMAVVGKEKKISRSGDVERRPGGYVSGTKKAGNPAISMNYIPRFEVETDEKTHEEIRNAGERKPLSHVVSVSGHVRQIPMEYSASMVCRKRAETEGIALPPKGFTYVASFFRGVGKESVSMGEVVKKVRVRKRTG